MSKNNSMSKALVRRETIAGYAFYASQPDLLFGICDLSHGAVCVYEFF